MSYYKGLVDEIILPGTQLPLNEDSFQGACWAMEIAQYRSDDMIERLKKIHDLGSGLSLHARRSFWEAVYALYPGAFVDEARDFLNTASGPKLFAMAAYYLLGAEPCDSLKAYIESALKENFSQDERENDPVLLVLQQSMRSKPQTPPLSDLLQSGPAGVPLIYVFLRQNRDYPGIALLRNETGDWARDEKGNILHTRILGRAVSNLPGTITHGNTPQGIYTLLGTGTSENVFIGPSRTIIAGLPFEYDVSIRELNDYQSLLPDTWVNYFPIYEAWYAGQAGRSEIIIHGSTLLPELYECSPYYPLTPSLGCMTHYEKWSKNGRLIESDQHIMVEALLACKKQEGFIFVVELDDKNRALEFSDIKDYLK
ncbi:MAG: hypothetical protein JXR21_01115 [Candidatus Marinimicrobia bacterium]|nr:hypothetical protein [Candidatus Neomarinimicrobiota bacterium]